MKAVTWQGKKTMAVEEVPDPRIEHPTDAVIKVTSTGLCGSDLHLYDPLSPFMSPGDIVGHEAMGIVEEVGSEVTAIAPGDRVVVPFNISCGGCWMCDQGLFSQCETTQNTEHGTGASLFGYSKLYGQVPGGQAELLRVPFANVMPIKVPHGPPDDRFVFLSDVLPTAWQAVEYAGVGADQTLLVLGAGPIGDMAARIALRRGRRVMVVDPVPERLARVAAYGAEALGDDTPAAVVTAVRDATSGRGADAVIDAVGMEAHGSPFAESVAKFVGLLPDAVSEPLMRSAGVDRLAALHLALDAVRRGGTVSVSGVYGGAMDPLPMMEMFDKQIQLRMGQANVLRWSDDILALLLEDEDVLGVESFATHHLPLDAAPDAYRDFRSKADGMVKVVFQP
ncbi:threonine dehydrogenase-like Zn-dependent dehydrogenase [Nocardioides thalensis]|uniref:Threonine dehydrogenase-like Zn-dependent dehydrogenase n=1 Tax=Nocardioides thalensis TaxID=1914755 RepID=A0A853BYN7_9ACTN|nr:alcohol dehydrogenase catalytic domain-containing protein [Nocardioides thalensis]NYI99855.1 threonine dehydrogenase-like Zn-dependent dehydrogenase [Nocardioides thalensis]